MSIDIGSVVFLERLNEDLSLQAELAAALEGVEDKTGAVVAFAATKGIRVDRTGFDAARAALARELSGSDRLDEGELETVAGGFNPQTEPPARLASLAGRVRPMTKKLILLW